MAAAVLSGAVMVDRMEINTLYDHDGNVVLKQLIFWEFVDGDYYVQDWRLLKNRRVLRDGDRWRVVIRDDKSSLDVVTYDVITTHTQHDPEVRDRKRLPVDQRTGLTPRIGSFLIAP